MNTWRPFRSAFSAGCRAAAIGSMVAVWVAPAAIHWPHWTAIFTEDTRTFGAGDQMWPNPDCSVQDLLTLHGYGLIVYGVSFGIIGSALTVAVTAPLGGAMGVLFYVARARPILRIVAGV